MKEKILKIVTIDGVINSRRITESYFKKNHIDIYLAIIKLYNNKLKFGEILYLILNDLLAPPTCIICNKLVRFRKFSQGYSKYCSMKCIGKDKNVQIKRENTSLNNFGEKYTLLSKEKREKIKNTNLKKYGVKYPQQLDSIKDKVIKTNLKKYGVEHHLKLETQLNKQKQTMLLNYGVDNPMKNDKIKLKAKITTFERYGVDSYSKTDEFKNKQKINNVKKYGMNSYFKTDEFKKKCVETNLKKYGVKSYSMTPEYIELVKKTKLKKYNDENYNNREQSKITSTLKYGVDNPSKSDFIINKIRNVINNKFKIKYSNLLSISINDIQIKDTFIIIKKYCKIHDEFEISKSLLYSRLIFNKHENICTKCNPIAETTSILENELKNFIKTLNIKSINNETLLLENNQEIDIYFPDHKLGIELNGLYWHSNLFKNNNYHLNKTKECENMGIQLLHVFDNEWVYKKEIIKSIIKSKLGLINTKIYARKCVVKEIKLNESNSFLENNHIQGSVNSKIKLGLYYNDDLVSIMTFEIARKGLGNTKNNCNFYNLNRFSNKLNISVIGGASKLLFYFIKNYNPKTIITYADRRFSQGNLYEKLNFKMVHINKPSFFYFNNNKKIKYHRFKYRKDNLIKLGWFDKNKSNDEILLEHNILKIYDCGSIKYQMNL